MTYDEQIEMLYDEIDSHERAIQWCYDRIDTLNEFKDDLEAELERFDNLIVAAGIASTAYDELD